ncbi:valine--tRNA ligase [Collinsella sp. zg1085]|uniref:valine--tRNA ligase n=1 Tax=Collinsella sp. zg1085 TaxID=2844380 RepID=UPI001C0BD099|nr:valine--tRNA ligase [Collinsella sp. zg1085]QWT18204.1 valine--tRNA ligase [Collinsella sp. zg1085]
MVDMPKTYDPALIEPSILASWLDKGYYRRRGNIGDCTITIPPPNVTGKLHMGHATDDTIQDTIVRMARMRGISTRWILGTDHAGIATQTKVDKKLKSEGKSRLEMGREAFLDACWDWTHEYGGIIVEQIKRMGCSIDFEHERFTMDDDYAAAVRKVFVDWYHDGLIYRGHRIVNWCPQCTTAISDDEAEYKTEAGHLWYLRYPLTEPVNGQNYIVVATTRPETMLGDTGIAVSPKDPEKAAFVGKTVTLPITNREIPIFEDWHVDAGFGTGFVKVTPAHDLNDYAMGLSHDLEQINIFDEHAVVVPGFGEFSGMTREQCREAVLAWFSEHDLLDDTVEHEHAVMHCYRCDTTLEPWLSEQWFVAVDKLKTPALQAVKDGRVRFHPERWTQTYTTWMENLKDWCISRQLWWGHRIPVFYCADCGWEDACIHDAASCPNCGSTHITQDENVLDTWFSSQLWTFATQGWPQLHAELEAHHPTAALVTARDIIALWVARMIMSSLYFLDEIPFKDVVIYPTILAKDGSRMSKSKGNGVDPMELIERYGADAMRFNLLTLCTTNQDVKFDADIDVKTHVFKGSPRTEQARSFVTKIWNASRFLLMNMEGYTPGAPRAETAADAWMFSRLARASQMVTQGIESYSFGEMARNLQSFFWNEVCDWYIEVSKARLMGAEHRLQAQRNLIFVLDASLRLMHPLMPFVTEAVWQEMPASYLDFDTQTGEISRSDALMIAAWPEPARLSEYINDEAERSFELLRTVVSAARSTRARYRLSPKEKLSCVVNLSPNDVSRFESLVDLAASLAHIELHVGSNLSKPEASVALVDTGIEVFVVLAGKVNFAAEVARLTKEIAQATKELEAATRTLSNEGFLAKAAPEVVAGKRARAAELTETIENLKAQLTDFDNS